MSSARQRLITLLGHIHFGRVLDLQVRGGQPIFDDPPPRIVRTVKLAGTSQPRAAAPAAGVPLKRELADLLGLLDRLGDGLIGRIEVAHGVPLFVDVHEAAPTS